MSTAKEKNLVLLLGGLGVLFLALSRKTLSIPGFAMQPMNVLDLATKVVQENGFSVDPVMLAAIAQVESGGNPIAVRYEAHINDASVGLMQTLMSTARWLATDMGYTRYGVPGFDDLLDPEISMYFAAAFIQWLKSYGGVPRDEEFIVRSYNGGPGADNPATAAYWSKYTRQRYGAPARPPKGSTTVISGDGTMTETWDMGFSP